MHRAALQSKQVEEKYSDAMENGAALQRNIHAERTLHGRLTIHLR